MRPVVTIAPDMFGPSRLLFGSGWPVVDLSGLDKWFAARQGLTAGMSESERAAIFAGNTIATYLGATDA
jgi:L-fuconolactonase